MSELIKLGCTVADVYHRYHAIHNSLFGLSYARRLLQTIRGTSPDTYARHSTTLKALQEELAGVKQQVADPQQGKTITGADRELRKSLLEYTQALRQAVIGLEKIYGNLAQEETAYRALGEDGRSPFTADKLEYDRLLSELERIGTRLERLFVNY